MRLWILYVRGLHGDAAGHHHQLNIRPGGIARIGYGQAHFNLPGSRADWLLNLVSFHLQHSP